MNKKQVAIISSVAVLSMGLVWLYQVRKKFQTEQAFQVCASESLTAESLTADKPLHQIIEQCIADKGFKAVDSERFVSYREEVAAAEAFHNRLNSYHREYMKLKTQQDEIVSAATHKQD